MNEIQESNETIRDVWSMYALGCGGELFEADGVFAAWAGVRWPIVNSIFLPRPVDDVSDLRRRLQTVATFTGKKTQAGMLVTCDSWIPSHPEFAAELAAHGWVPVQPIYGMVSEELRPGPNVALEFRRISQPELRRVAAAINGVCYEVPEDMALEALDREALWGPACFGYAGFSGAQAVTTATTYVRKNNLYVALVATPPEFRKRGYGAAATEYSMREASRSSGLKRTVLHATPIAKPIYESLGFRDIAPFTMHLPAAFLQSLSAPPQA